MYAAAIYTTFSLYALPGVAPTSSLSCGHKTVQILVSAHSCMKETADIN